MPNAAEFSCGSALAITCSMSLGGGHAKDDLVRMEGLEPTHLTALEPKSSASTNSATFA